ncbi:MAG: beta-galactosidase [Anaerolineales bacterium]
MFTSSRLRSFGLSVRAIVPRAWRPALLLVVLVTLRSPGPRVVPGPLQVVDTAHPLVCAHTRLTDEVEPWKIQRTLQMVREMGASTIVEYFPWAYVEADEGRYDWQHSDLVIEHARAQGLRVVARVGLVPAWARPRVPDGAPPPTDTHLTAARFPDFARFAGDFAARYRGRIEAIVIWNEPNLSLEWGFRSVDPAAYVELLQQSRAAIRHSDPEVLVLAGALAPTLEPAGSAAGMNALDYLSAMYAAGLAGASDGLAIHSYGLGAPAAAPPASDELNYRYAELQRELMVAYGDADKPVYVTEAGWNDSPRWAFAVSPTQRIEYSLDAFRIAEDSWPWARVVCLWAFRYPTPTYGYYDNYTLVADDFEPKPIYYAVQAWARRAAQ